MLVLGTGTAREQSAPHPSQGSARCHHRRVLPANPPVMGAGCPAGPIPPSPSLGAHRQERGAEQAAVPALGLLLPVFTCSDSHHVGHDSLPLSCSAARPSRGGAGSPTGRKGQNLLTQLCLLLFLSPPGPRPGGTAAAPPSMDAPSPHGRHGLAAALAGSGRRQQRQLWQSLARTNSNQVSGERLDENASPTPAQALLKDIATHPCYACWSRGD